MNNRMIAAGVALVLLVGGILGYYRVIENNTVPLTQQIVQAGYAVTDLANPTCANFDGEYDCDNKAIAAASKDVNALTYHPAGSPGYCNFRFTRIGAGVLRKSSWQFSFYIDKVDGITPNLNPQDPQRGSVGGGWSQDDAGRQSVSIRTPSPTKLWEFVKAHFRSPDPKCEPRRA